jgi:hypothetical protein
MSGNDNPLLSAVAAVALATSAMAFGGNAAPPPSCVISDIDPPTNVRTQPNGVIIHQLPNGTQVRVVDQTRDANGHLWDFITTSAKSP